ncbi:MAG TPA: DUF2905 domain-containing protein [Burkholderiales bacterium]|nr:DUF2905 domain-containing protein [Burkholderiales bacterium]
MLKWLFTLFVALAVFGFANLWLARLGLGRLPGDLRLRVGGRELHLPFASTVLLSALAMLIGRLIF